MEYVYDQLQELHTLIASLREEVATLQSANNALSARVESLEGQIERESACLWDEIRKSKARIGDIHHKQEYGW